ncbi:MAG TPA: hypothetical protein VFL74_05285 [Sphingomicrobium sp.]|jgi:hypothetical protein|nr:hypothetical protein [Sphingomicrobium sp.]
MFRPLFALSALAVAASPAAAATYSAKTSAPAPAERIASRDILWTCASGACTGSTANSRPVVLCEGLAKKAGRIDSFLVDGREIPADELRRCNASARETGSALANAR